MKNLILIIPICLIFLQCDDPPPKKKNVEVLKFVKLRNCEEETCEIKNIHESKTIVVEYRKVTDMLAGNGFDKKVTLEPQEIRIINTYFKDFQGKKQKAYGLNIQNAEWE